MEMQSVRLRGRGGEGRMGRILSIYSSDTYQEIRLPEEQEGVQEISLSGFPELSFRLSLQIRGGRTELLPSGSYTLRPARGRRRFPLPLETGQVYFLTPDSGGRLVLMARTVDESSQVIRVYRLDAAVTIGAAPENTIVYGGWNTVSPLHAVLVPHDGGHRLEDRSRNGVYVGRRRVTGSTELKYGDFIHLCGLSVVYLGSRVALVPPASDFAVGAGLTLVEESPLPEDLQSIARMDPCAFPGGDTFEGAASETVLPAETELFDEETAGREPDSEGETLLEPVTPEENAAMEPSADTEDETVWEAASDREEETVLETASGPESETVLERIPGAEENADPEPDEEDATVLERPQG